MKLTVYRASIEADGLSLGRLVTETTSATEAEAACDDYTNHGPDGVAVVVEASDGRTRTIYSALSFDQLRVAAACPDEAEAILFDYEDES